MVTSVPGPKVAALMEESAKYEAFTRGGGGFPVILEHGKGATVKDADGNLFIDMAAGVAVNAVGRGHPKILEAINRQCGVIMHTTDITNPKRIELAKKVSGVMPEGLRGNCHTSFFQAGSDAVETAIKFSRRVTGRTQILAFQGAYHGVWCGTSALTTGYNYRHGWGPLIAGVQHLPYAYCYRCPFNMTYPNCDVQCGKYVDYVLNTPYTAADDVAAVIVEAEQGEGGYVAPPPEFFQMIRAGLRQVRLSVRRRRGAVGRGPHRQDVVHRAQRREARHAHLGQGHGRRHTHGRHHLPGRFREEPVRGFPALHLRRQRAGLRSLHDQHRPDPGPADGSHGQGDAGWASRSRAS